MNGDLFGLWRVFMGCRLFSFKIILLTFGLLSANVSLCSAFVENDAAGIAKRQEKSAEPAQEKETESKSARPGFLVQVPLPINYKNAVQVRKAIERIVDQAPEQVRPDRRHVVVLEFDTSNGKTGQGSSREACQMLARYLIDKSLQRLETVAYVPVRRGYVPDSDVDSPVLPNQLQGHAVLVAIACDGVVMHNDSEMGRAGIDDQADVDRQLSRNVYEIIGRENLKAPLPYVMSLVDPDRELHWVVTDKERKVVGAAEFKQLLEDSNVEETDPLAERGKLPMFSSEKLGKYGLIRHRVPTRSELARKLNLTQNSLVGNPTLGKEWRPILVQLPELIDSRTVDWMMRSLAENVASSGEPEKANLVIVQISSTGGDPDTCLRLARKLAEYDPNNVFTVAYVDGMARGPAGLVALACDQLVMSEDGVLGGPTDDPIAESELGDFKTAIEYIAQQKQTDWSLMLAMLDPGTEIGRYQDDKHSSQLRLLCEEQLMTLENPGDWRPRGAIDMENGLDAATAEKLFVARATVTDFEGVKSFYQLDETPRTLQPTVTDRWLEQLAARLASPEISMMLLFGAMFFLSTEMSAPGIGVPGFLGTLCLMAFFWSQYLDGNADWLEIMLFVVGIIFIFLEMFVIPGFGLFGVGGLLMVVFSIGLASQSSFPNTTEELARLPRNLLPLMGALGGFVVALIVLRNVLPNAPYFKRMMLQPRKLEETGLEEQRDPEMVVDYSSFNGKKGKAVTRLAPSGKAIILGKLVDVITDGRMVDKDQAIEVIEATGNRIVVKPLV